MNSSNLRVLGVQRAIARKVQIAGRSILTAIHKTAVHEAVELRPLGLVGDEQADLSVHGGLDKAVYAYPSEHYSYWQQERHQAGLDGIDNDLPFGAMGENLTLQGLLETDVWVGDVLHFSACSLRVTAPREPCYKFNAAMGFSHAVKRMAQTGFCGFYLAVDRPGAIASGETFVLEPGPRRLSIPQRFEAKMFKHMR
ncbi:MOSC domain-containing protein [Rhodoferax aquaticus]|uniref:MOSC domain-containing protein n=1 Tax=Rhodoferax aquaticus TaxID=2527691 RepID=UPI001F1DDC99|nr:MOSC domain-containing protein [Rhodoferax aquaticus]